MGRSAAALALTLLLPTGAAAQADRPVARTDRNSQIAHEQLLAKARAGLSRAESKGRIDVYFAGDSSTRRWGATDYPELLAHWTQSFSGWNAGNFGWGADRIEHILWRLDNGELDGVDPKVIVLLAGTNNVGNMPRADDEALVEDVTRGLKAVLGVMRAKAPDATIVLMAIFPRNDNIAVMPTIVRINQRLEALADGKAVRYLDINERLADASGTLHAGMMHDGLHPSVAGYQLWAEALTPLFTELLGPRAAIDLAPPPTGDPSAQR